MTHPVEQIRLEFERARRTRDQHSLAHLGEYFLPSVHRSRPFDVGVKLNPKKFAQGADALPYEMLVSDVLTELANAIERERRLQAYRRLLSSGYRGPILVSEGDSWFQYPFFIDETIDHLMPKYAVYSLDGAGHLLTDMEAQDEYTEPIRRESANYFLLSGGGNDMLERGRFAEFLHPYRPGMSADNVINKQYLQSFLDSIGAVYERMFARLTSEFSSLKILCHGYDYAIPRNGGTWLGRPLASRRVPRTLWADIVKVVIDRFNSLLKSFERKYRGRVFHVDCRNAVGEQRNWFDELHPTSAGFDCIARKFSNRINLLEAK